jgi:hypothetical protein
MTYLNELKLQLTKTKVFFVRLTSSNIEKEMELHMKNVLNALKDLYEMIFNIQKTSTNIEDLISKIQIKNKYINQLVQNHEKHIRTI